MYAKPISAKITPNNQTHLDRHQSQRNTILRTHPYFFLNRALVGLQHPLNSLCQLLPAEQMLLESSSVDPLMLLEGLRF